MDKILNILFIANTRLLSFSMWFPHASFSALAIETIVFMILNPEGFNRFILKFSSET